MKQKVLLGVEDGESEILKLHKAFLHMFYLLFLLSFPF